MTTKIRLARGGSKKRAFYHIVVADERSPRDGRFIEKLGTYNPILAKDNENRVTLVTDRIQYWLSQGAKPTDRVYRFLEARELLPKKIRKNLKKALPGQRAKERLENKQSKAAEAKSEASE